MLFFSILKDGKHGVIDGRWVCGQCGKSLSSPSGLDQHIQTVHGAYILPCDHCDLKFKRKDHVRKTKNRIYDEFFNLFKWNLIFLQNNANDEPAKIGPVLSLLNFATDLSQSEKV